ncbi:transposase [Bradyrhizobium sp. 190]|nr:transposase [Bradyrhizobium sp. 190]
MKFNVISISPNAQRLKPVGPLYRRGSRDVAGLYARHGRHLDPPERLLRAQPLQAFQTVRSEREQLDYNLLFRWFVGRSINDPAWDATVFCKNRDRLLDGDIAAKFFVTVLNLPQVRGPSRRNSGQKAQRGSSQKSFQSQLASSSVPSDTIGLLSLAACSRSKSSLAMRRPMMRASVSAARSTRCHVPASGWSLASLLSLAGTIRPGSVLLSFSTPSPLSNEDKRE